jgi:hypothetical protein
VTWSNVAILAAVAQGAGTLAALYLTILLLRQTGIGIQTALHDYNARLSPHITIYGKVDIAFGVAQPRISLISKNQGIGPAIDLLLSSKSLSENPSVVAADVCITEAGGVAILGPGDSVAWTASGVSDNGAHYITLLVCCQDIEGGEWEFSYMLQFPEHGGSITAILTRIRRPRNEVVEPLERHLRYGK